MKDESSPPDERAEEIPVEVTSEEPTTKAAAPAMDSEPVSAEDRIAQLEKEKKETYERLLRTAADFDNFRKRVRRDIDEGNLKTRETVLKEMLPVVDNLERAIQAASGAGEAAAAVVNGVKLVLRQLINALERFEVKPVEAMGKPFDPAFHEAIQQIESADHPAGTVVAEMQKGYSIGARLLRPAMVAVSKLPAGGKVEPNGAGAEAGADAGTGGAGTTE